MTNTFIVGIDGSDGATRAVEFASKRAEAGQAKIVLVYVIEWSPYSFNTPEENDQRHKRREEEIERAQTQVVNPMVESLNGRGLTVESMVRHGHAAEVLCRLATEESATQIFVGRRGESKLATLLFGSVTGSLVQASPVPITVVP